MCQRAAVHGSVRGAAGVRGGLGGGGGDLGARPRLGGGVRRPLQPGPLQHVVTPGRPLQHREQGTIELSRAQ